jgi:dTDP-4-amino-4,6-dideoxygalactose transaminase
MVKLAVDGGPKACPPGTFSSRGLFGTEERDAAVAMFDEAIASGGVIGYNGREELAYEKEFAEYMGGGFVDGVNSGTTALYCAVGALKLRPGSEVVVPPITDPGGCMPIALHNLIPVPADCAPGTYNAGAEQIEAAITEHTSAIVVAHIAGEPCDMGPIMAVARKYGLPVVEDCAQAHGARYNGQLAGTIGDIAAISTMSGKHHASGPQGGLVFSKSEALIQECKRVSDRGKPFFIEGPTGNAGGNVRAGLNLNSNDLSAAIGRVQLRKLEAAVAVRREVAAGVAAGLQKAGCVATKLGFWPEESNPSHWFLRIHIDAGKLATGKTKLDFAAAVSAEGVGVAAEYRYIVPEMPWFINKNVFPGSDLPWSLPEYTGDAGSRDWEMPNAVSQAFL